MNRDALVSNNCQDNFGSSGEVQPIKPPRVVANLCNTSTCPTMYESEPGTLLVQGYTVPAGQHGIDVPAGESLVEIPADLLAEALRNLS
jgi:hypothetical protein